MCAQVGDVCGENWRQVKLRERREGERKGGREGGREGERENGS